MKLLTRAEFGAPESLVLAEHFNVSASLWEVWYCIQKKKKDRPLGLIFIIKNSSKNYSIRLHSSLAITQETATVSVSRIITYLKQNHQVPEEDRDETRRELIE